MTPAPATFFEHLYRAEIDPWGYTDSAYERAKYELTLHACGPGPFERALELGGSIGVFSALLAPRCVSLETIDGAPTAVEAAVARLEPYPQAVPVCGAIPEDIGPGPFDLVVASEILYYLDADGLRATLRALRERTSAGTRVVAVHWRPRGSERPADAEAVHAALRAERWLTTVVRSSYPEFLLDVLVRR